MRGHPVANALRRDFVARDEIAVDEHALDRAKAITVVRIEADAQRRAVLEDHAPRAFDLDREQVGRIPEPAEFEFLTVERAGLDGAAVVSTARVRCSRCGDRSARPCSEMPTEPGL